MRAIIQKSYNGINDLAIETVADPTLSPLSAIIRTKFTPILPYNWMTEEGALMDIRPTKLPMVIGYGFAGVVEKVGMLRNSHLVGKRVIGANMSGSNAELINSQLPPLLFEVPDAVKLADAATVIGGADAALFAVNKAHVQNNETVLITGASGGVGTYLIQFLKRLGATVIALGSDQNITFLRDLGADYVVNYEQNLSNALKAAPQPTKIIDTVGSTGLLDTLTTNYEALQILSLSLPNYRTKKNGQSFSFGSGNIGLSGYKQILQLLATHQLQPVVQDIYPYDEVIKAQTVSKYQHSHGRILLSFDEAV